MGFLQFERFDIWTYVRPPVAGGEAAAAKPLGGGLGGAGATPSITSSLSYVRTLSYAPGVGENILSVFFVFLVFKILFFGSVENLENFSAFRFFRHFEKIAHRKSDSSC